MKKTALMVLFLWKLALGVNLGLVSVTDTINIPVICLDTLGRKATPDSAHAFVWYHGEGANDLTYSATNSGAGASGDWLDSISVYGGTVYHFIDVVGDIDSNRADGLYSGSVNLWSQGQPIYNPFSFTKVGDEIKDYLATIYYIRDTVNAVVDTLQNQDDWVAQQSEVQNLDGWNPITDNDSLVIDLSTVDPIIRVALHDSLTKIIDSLQAVLDTLQNQDNWIAQQTEIANLNGWNPTSDSILTKNPDAYKANVNNLDVAVSSRAVAGDAMILTASERASIADSVWKENLSSHKGNMAGHVLLSQCQYMGWVTQQIDQSHFKIGGTMTTYGNDFFNNLQLVFTDGNLLGRASRIVDWSQSDSTLTVDALFAQPTANDTFAVVPFREANISQISRSVPAADSLKSILTNKIIQSCYDSLKNQDNWVAKETTVSALPDTSDIALGLIGRHFARVDEDTTIDIDAGGMIQATADLPESLFAKIDSANVSLGYDSQSAHSKIDELSVATGSGTEPETLFVYDQDTTGIYNVSVTIRPVGGGGAVAKSSTNQNGCQIFNLDVGDYAVALFKEGYLFNPVDTISVGAGGGTDSLWGAVITHDPPPADMTIILTWVITAGYDTLTPSYIRWRPVKADSSRYGRNDKLTVGSGVNQAVIAKDWTLETADSSNFEFHVFANKNLSDTLSLYEFIAYWRDGEITRVITEIPDTTTFNPFGQ